MVFATLVAAVLLVEGAVTRSAAFARGGAVPIAVFVDLMIVLPLLFGVIILRPARRPWLDAAPVLAFGAFAAGALLSSWPAARPLLRVGGALSELAVLSLLARRLRAAARELRGVEGDDLVLRALPVTDPLLRFLALELAVVYYALVGPWIRRPLRDGELSYTRESGLGGLLFGLGVLLLTEGLAIHMLLQTWSPRAAWVLAGLNVYALLWLAGVHQAARLRPVVVSSERLLLRASLLWTVVVPRGAVGSVRPIHAMPRVKGVLRLALGTAPNLLLSLREPVVARGMLGIERRVTRIALYVDDPEALSRWG